MLEYNAEGFSLDIAIKEHKIAVEVCSSPTCFCNVAI